MHMKTHIRLLLLLALALLVSSCNKPVNALLVVGGHSYDTTEFYEMFRSLENLVFDTVSHPYAMDMLGSEQVDPYDLLIFYDFIPDMPLEDSSIYLQLTQQGIPILFLHHAICTFQQWEVFQEIVGGKYVMPQYSTDSALFSDYRHSIDLPVEVVDKNHPVTSEMSDFEIHDEGYSNLTVWNGVEPLLSTEHPDCSPVIGWAHSYQNSLIVYLIFGHDKYAYENQSFQQLLNNSIEWLTNAM